MKCEHTDIAFELDVRKTYSVRLWVKQDGTKKYIDFLEEEFITGVDQSPFCLKCNETWTMEEFEEYKREKEKILNE